MEKVDLRDLENQTEALLNSYLRLKQENEYLLEKQARLMRERDEYQQKSQQAISKLEAVLARLQQLESGQL